MMTQAMSQIFRYCYQPTLKFLLKHKVLNIKPLADQIKHLEKHRHKVDVFKVFTTIFEESVSELQPNTTPEFSAVKHMLQVLRSQKSPNLKRNKVFHSANPDLFSKEFNLLTAERFNCQNRHENNIFKMESFLQINPLGHFKESIENYFGITEI